MFSWITGKDAEKDKGNPSAFEMAKVTKEAMADEAKVDPGLAKSIFSSITRKGADKDKENPSAFEMTKMTKEATADEAKVDSGTAKSKGTDTDEAEEDLGVVESKGTDTDEAEKDPDVVDSETLGQCTLDALFYNSVGPMFPSKSSNNFVRWIRSHTTTQPAPSPRAVLTWVDYLSKQTDPETYFANLSEESKTAIRQHLAVIYHSTTYKNKTDFQCLESATSLSLHDAVLCTSGDNVWYAISTDAFDELSKSEETGTDRRLIPNTSKKLTHVVFPAILPKDILEPLRRSDGIPRTINTDAALEARLKKHSLNAEEAIERMPFYVPIKPYNTVLFELSRLRLCRVLEILPTEAQYNNPEIQGILTHVFDTEHGKVSVLYHYLFSFLKSYIYHTIPRALPKSFWEKEQTWHALCIIRQSGLYQGASGLYWMLNHSEKCKPYLNALPAPFWQRPQTLKALCICTSGPDTGTSGLYWMFKHSEECKPYLDTLPTAFWQQEETWAALCAICEFGLDQDTSPLYWILTDTEKYQHQISALPPAFWQEEETQIALQNFRRSKRTLTEKPSAAGTSETVGVLYRTDPPEEDEAKSPDKSPTTLDPSGALP